MEERPMPTAKEYRHRAQEYMELAKESKELYAKEAMTALAKEFNRAAEKLEREHLSRPPKLGRAPGRRESRARASLRPARMQEYKNKR